MLQVSETPQPHFIDLQQTLQQLYVFYVSPDHLSACEM